MNKKLSHYLTNHVNRYNQLVLDDAFYDREEELSASTDPIYVSIDGMIDVATLISFSDRYRDHFTRSNCYEIMERYLSKVEKIHNEDYSEYALALENYYKEFKLGKTVPNKSHSYPFFVSPLTGYFFLCAALKGSEALHGGRLSPKSRMIPIHAREAIALVASTFKMTSLATFMEENNVKVKLTIIKRVFPEKETYRLDIKLNIDGKYSKHYILMESLKDVPTLADVFKLESIVKLLPRQR